MYVVENLSRSRGNARSKSSSKCPQADLSSNRHCYSPIPSSPSIPPKQRRYHCQCRANPTRPLGARVGCPPPPRPIEKRNHLNNNNSNRGLNWPRAVVVSTCSDELATRPPHHRPNARRRSPTTSTTRHQRTLRVAAARSLTRRR